VSTYELKWADGSHAYVSELEDWFASELDEALGPVRVGALEYDAALVLRKVDPIAYQQAYAEWLDSMIEDGQIVEVEL
jgi:hypothetical protein